MLLTFPDRLMIYPVGGDPNQQLTFGIDGPGISGLGDVCTPGDPDYNSTTCFVDSAFNSLGVNAGEPAFNPPVATPGGTSAAPLPWYTWLAFGGIGLFALAVLFPKSR